MSTRSRALLSLHASQAKQSAMRTMHSATQSSESKPWVPIGGQTGRTRALDSLYTAQAELATTFRMRKPDVVYNVKTGMFVAPRGLESHRSCTPEQRRDDLTAALNRCKSEARDMAILASRTMAGESTVYNVANGARDKSVEVLVDTMKVTQKQPLRIQIDGQALNSRPVQRDLTRFSHVFEE